MFARLVEATAKPGKREEIAAILINELLPFAKTQTGFVDALGLTDTTKPNLGMSLTLWEAKEDVEMYLDTPEHKKILNRITPLLQTISVRTFTVEASTFHKITAAMVA